MTRSDREQRARDAVVRAAMKAWGAPISSIARMRAVSALWDSCISLSNIQKEKRRVR